MHFFRLRTCQATIVRATHVQLYSREVAGALYNTKKAAAQISWAGYAGCNETLLSVKEPQLKQWYQTCIPGEIDVTLSASMQWYHIESLAAVATTDNAYCGHRMFTHHHCLGLLPLWNILVGLYMLPTKHLRCRHSPLTIIYSIVYNFSDILCFDLSSPFVSAPGLDLASGPPCWPVICASLASSGKFPEYELQPGAYLYVPVYRPVPILVMPFLSTETQMMRTPHASMCKRQM